MIKVNFLCLVIFVLSTSFSSASKFSCPVDISFLVADVKYSETKGVQICEIQHGTDSIFKGEAYSNNGLSRICENFVHFFSSYQQSFWCIPSGVCDELLVKMLTESSWKMRKTYPDLLMDRDFQRVSSQKVTEVDRIAGYQGCVLAISSAIGKLENLLSGDSVILIDRSMLPVWRDKYRVSQFFKDDPTLESCKPKWNLYQKIYHKDLAKQIIKDIGAGRYVIKPRDRCRGNGVIIVEEDDLDHVLRYILKKSKKLKVDPDRAYRSWYNDDGDSFLVEEFVSSDPILVPHLGMKPYCPTLRIVFLAIYEKGEEKIFFLGGYNCLPEKSLEEFGSLHEKYKASLETVHSSQIDPQTLECVKELLDEPLRLFYRKVLDSQSF